MKNKLKSLKPKKVIKEEILEQEIQEEVKEVLAEVEKPKRGFVYGDFITDTHTGKTFIYHGQNSVKENLDRFILVAPNL